MFPLRGAGGRCQSMNNYLQCTNTQSPSVDISGRTFGEWYFSGFKINQAQSFCLFMSKKTEIPSIITVFAYIFLPMYFSTSFECARLYCSLLKSAHFFYIHKQVFYTELNINQQRVDERPYFVICNIRHISDHLGQSVNWRFIQAICPLAPEILISLI